MERPKLITKRVTMRSGRTHFVGTVQQLLKLMAMISSQLLADDVGSFEGCHFLVDCFCWCLLLELFEWIAR